MDVREVSLKGGDMMGADKAEIISNVISDKEDSHDAEIASIEEATAQAVVAETPLHPDGDVSVSVPMFPRQKTSTSKRKHDPALYAEVDYGI